MLRAALDLGAARVAAAPALVLVLPRAVAARVRAGAPHRHAVATSNRAKQIADGAPRREDRRSCPTASTPAHGRGASRDAPPAGDRGSVIAPAGRAACASGFVGRVVPIKDLVTFVARLRPRAAATSTWTCASSARWRRTPAYAARCRAAGRDARARGRRSSSSARCRPAQIYADLDVVVLTSFSEGQPLVILEAYAWGLPVIATDVGACREMIEGRTERRPAARAERLRHPRRHAEGDRRRAGPAGARRRGCAGGWAPAGAQRVTAYYQRQDMLRSRLPRRSTEGADRGVLMAGIGWKLQRMIDRGSLAGTIGAYLTGVAVTSAPGC